MFPHMTVEVNQYGAQIEETVTAVTVILVFICKQSIQAMFV